MKQDKFQKLVFLYVKRLFSLVSFYVLSLSLNCSDQTTVCMFVLNFDL